MRADATAVWPRRGAPAGMHRQVLTAATTVAVVAVSARLASVARDLVIAYRFGADAAVDAFLIAYLVPYTVLAIAGGALHSAFLPAYVQARATGGSVAANALLSALTARVLLGIGVLLAIAAFGGEPLLRMLSGFTAEQLRTTHFLLLLLLPAGLLGSIVMLWTAVLNAERIFAVPAAAPAIPPVGLIAAALLFGQHAGIEVVAGGLLLGHALEAAVVGTTLHRRGVSLRPIWSAQTPPLQPVMAQLGPLIGATALMSATVLVDQAMAARLGAGSVAVLSYANKLTAAVIGVGALALGTAVFPHFAEMIAAGRRTELRHVARSYSRIILWTAIIPTIALVAGSERIAALIFERGAFTHADTIAVAAPQALYLLQTPFYLVGILGVRLLTAAGLSRTVMLVAAANLVTNVIGNLLFMQWFGVAGIALATSVVYALSALLIFMALNRYLDDDRQ